MQQFLLNILKLIKYGPVGYVILFAGFGLFGKVKVDQAPVHEFEMPIFADNGYKHWYLSGKKGVLCADQSFDIERMRLEMFEPGQLMVTQGTLESVQAKFFPKDRYVCGDHYLFFTMPNCTIVGCGWTFKSFKQIENFYSFELKLNSCVRVVIKGCSL